ncbi:MAG: hypothetical protein VX190_05185 [Bacteroidota bacterium]|nr:hypothetical protein [Bacteroidota bacterium]MEC7950732.1 hypothetical protein [Bacteroidota bacterium]MEC8361324.1 hypothetical protein [Bacteroidota bacterium]MEC8368584.1 hypothetical protein [Bacteroidota bacterium]
MKLSTAGALGGLALGLSLFSACGQTESSCTAPKLAPNQPNGSSALASAMVAMDSQLQIVLEAVMADPNHAWAGFTLESHDLLALEPTDASMVNGHFTTHAPLYLQAIAQFNKAPSAGHFNAVVSACADCHHGTCPGPLTRIEKRRPQLD